MAAIEYNAISLGLVGIMFFLLEIGSKINFQTTGKGVIDINSLAKTFFVFMSIGAGWALVTFLVSLANNETTGIALVANGLIWFWVLITGAMAIFFAVYFVAIAPKIARGSNGEE